jgi:hypothetical protein
VAQKPEKAKVDIGEFADAMGLVGSFFELAILMNKLVTDEQQSDPLMSSLNRIHARLSEINDNVLASWATTREQNIAFILAHSFSALDTVNKFVKSGGGTL